MNVKKPERCIEPIFWICPLCEYFIKLLVWANLKHSEFTRNMTSGTVDNPTDSLEFTQFIQCMTAVTQMSSNSSSGTWSALSEGELVMRCKAHASGLLQGTAVLVLFRLFLGLTDYTHKRSWWENGARVSAANHSWGSSHHNTRKKTQTDSLLKPVSSLAVC